MCDSTKSQLETLSNELLYEIFRYTCAKDLSSFKGLNKRIDSIVHDVTISLDSMDIFNIDNLISVFSPSQVIRFEIRLHWAFDAIKTMQNLRSLIISSSFVLNRNFEAFFGNLSLPKLEWLSMKDASHIQLMFILEIIAVNRQFPSLIGTSIGTRNGPNFDFRPTDECSNKILRFLSIEKGSPSHFYTLLRTFGNLHQFEISLFGSLVSSSNSLVSNSSLNHIRVTLFDLVADLEYLLKAAPNHKRLRLRGNLESNNVINQLEQMVKLLIGLAANLKKFDCELYCYSSDRNDKLSIIRQLHPLSNKIQYLIGPCENRCYATDLDVYPIGNEFERAVDVSHSSSLISCTYYDDDDDDEYHGHEYNENYVGGWEEDYEHRDMYWDAEADDWCPLP